MTRCKLPYLDSTADRCRYEPDTVSDRLSTNRYESSRVIEYSSASCNKHQQHRITTLTG